MFVPAAVVRRGEHAESWHFAAAAVVEPTGRRVASLGGPTTATYFRSSAKPFQAVPLVRKLHEARARGEAPFDLTAEDLGLICASHSGAPQHVERAAALLGGGDLAVEDLRCGAHPPLDRRFARRLRESGQEPGSLHNNCSGKHAGMLLACRLEGWPTDGYLDPDHPLQRAIETEVARFCGLPAERLGRGVDGCSAPTFHLPLEAAARGWAALAAPRLAGLPAAETAAAEEILEAMARAPEMVAGPERFTTRLAEVTGGRLVGKEGAEGVYCLAIRGPVALGAAFKIADGGERARDGIALELLRQVGSLSQEELGELESFYRPPVKNHRNRVVGRIEPDFELDTVPPETRRVDPREMEPLPEGAGGGGLL